MNPAEGAPRLLLGNLDGEEELALLSRTVRGGRPPRRHAWTRKALASAAGAATLLRVFARPGDRLWTPVPVDPVRAAAMPGLPRPALETGPLSELSPGAALLAWCETQTASALRAAGPGAGAARGVAEGGGTLDCTPPLHDLLWRLPAAPAAVVAAVNHRAFCLELQAQLGCALPGARMVESLAALESHLAGGAAEARSWVVKAPLSAAGRSRAIQRHDLVPAGLASAGLARPELRRRVENLFERHGPLLFEPWMERTADFGVAGLSLSKGVHWVGFHRQSVDVRGQFTGIELAVGGAGMSAIDELSPQDRESWQRVLEGVAGAFGRAGYSGPFGIDAWQYRDRDGAIRLQPLGEINARMTFGLIARALAERLREPLGLGGGDRVRLAFGPSLPAVESSAIEVVPLLLAGDAGETAAWLEVSRRLGSARP